MRIQENKVDKTENMKIEKISYPISVYVAVDMNMKNSAFGDLEERLINIRFVDLRQSLLEVFEGIIDYFECFEILLHLGLKLEIGCFFVLRYIDGLIFLLTLAFKQFVTF